jgi:DMSO reductase family type II enzyme chaperone
MRMSVEVGVTSGSEATLARSLTYRLLSQAFAYPLPGAVSQLVEEDLELALAGKASMPAGVPEALDAYAAALRDVVAEDLETAYRDAFSHIHSADCPMFETDYGARDVWRQSNVLADIAGFYRAFGIREHGERPDHVSAEFEFLHLLAYKQAWAEARGEQEHLALCRDAERTFLRDHVLTWIPGFAARVEAVAGDGVYGGAARLADAVLRAEAERLGLPIAEDLAPTPPGSLEEEASAFCEVDP